MPAFPMSEENRKTLIGYLNNKEIIPVKAENEHTDNVSASEKKEDFPYLPDYILKTWTRFTDHNGYIGVKPPWGTLNAIDLNTGDYLWTIPLGEFRELTEKGIPITGTETYGGPVVTSGGLVFIAATPDRKFAQHSIHIWSVLSPTSPLRPRY